MNETIKTILGRRSVRKFKTDPIPLQTLEQIVEAGLYAPSARNRQPWHLCVVQSAKRIDAITTELKAATARMPDNPYKGMVGTDGYTVNFHSPVFIIVSADPDVSPLVMADCALVLGNMFLAAYSLGIGSCWVNQLGAACGEPGFRAMLTGLGVPTANHIYGCGTFGYPEEMPKNAPPRKEGTVTYVPAQ
jgi:Nitroreductase